VQGARDVPAPSLNSASTGTSEPAPSTAASGASAQGDTSAGVQGMPTQEVPAALSVPCDVAAVVSEKCTLCHAATPKFNAPMPLMTLSDFQATAPVTATQHVYEVAATRVTAEGAAKMPPPATVDPLSDTQLDVLSSWLNAGAQGASDGCAITEAGDDSDETLAPMPMTSGVSTEPYEGWDDDVECYPFVANDGSKTAPYPVGTAVDEYVGFELMPPWQGTRYVRAYRAIVDNDQALHHYLLFAQGGPVVDGRVSPSSGAHPDGELMAGWAPGGNDLYFTPDVGAEMSGDSGYVLEIHYNSSDPNALDASGLEVCVTETRPEHLVTRSWLGTDRISGTSATGSCSPRANERIHIVLGTPHMHLKGKHMTVVVHRAGGMDDIVHDEDFAFENQRDYPEDLWLEPGDSIETTCEYSSPASFGAGTNQEMCYWFALHYPAGALTDGGFLGTALHGPNSCLGM
jgi:hypothetical protein